jgi:uncharacterized membrane protein
MQEFIYEYFVRPITDPSVQGYNIVNTIVLVSLLIIASALIYHFLKNKVEFNAKFFESLIPYILFGVSMRVIMHQIEAGILNLSWLTKTANPLELGFWFFTPGIWILTFILVAIGLLVARIDKDLNLKKLKIFGIIVMLPPLIFNLFSFNNWLILIGVLILIVVVSYGICYLINKFTKYKILDDKLNLYIVLGQGFDGIASAIAIAFFNFTEQHVVSDFLMRIHPGLFVIVKILVAALIAWSLDDYLTEKPEHKKLIKYIKVIIAILGFATGLASLLKLGVI